VEAAMEGKNRQLSPIENISINTKVLNQHSNDDILQISLRYYIIMPWECPALGPSLQWPALSEKTNILNLQQRSITFSQHLVKSGEGGLQIFEDFLFTHQISKQKNTFTSALKLWQRRVR
jgi:hypothetical protein